MDGAIGGAAGAGAGFIASTGFALTGGTVNVSLVIIGTAGCVNSLGVTGLRIVFFFGFTDELGSGLTIGFGGCVGLLDAEAGAFVTGFGGATKVTCITTG